MSMEIVTRAALGSIVPLGTLYDSRTDQFLPGLSIINRDIPDAAKEIIDESDSDLQIIYSDSISEKFSHLSVNSDLQISILLGLVTLAGSGEFISFPKSSSTSTRRSLIYKIKTKNEILRIFHPDLRSEFSEVALRRSSGGTHFVSQIHWGANSILMCEYVSKQDVIETDVGRKLTALLESAGRAIKGSKAVDLSDCTRSLGCIVSITDNELLPVITTQKSLTFHALSETFYNIPIQGEVGTDTAYNIRLFGDILPDHDTPLSIEAAVHLLKQVPSLINASESGWGKPVAYTLLPISILNGYLNETITEPVVQPISTATVVKVVRFFETLEKAQQLLFDFLVDVNSYQYGLQPDELSQVISYKNAVEAHVTGLKFNLTEIIRSVRANEEGPKLVENFLVLQQIHELSPTNITKKIREWSSIKRKVQFLKRLLAKEIKFIRSDWALEDLIEENYFKQFFVLYIQPHSLETNIANWRENTKLFLKQNSTDRDKMAFAVVDCNLVQCPPMNVTSGIQVMERGYVIVDNWLEARKRLEGQAVVNFLVDPKRIFPCKLSNELSPYTTHCPGQRCNRGATYNWTCSRCGKTVLIGDDDYLYCDCGQSYLNSTSYKCSDPRHGDDFDQHDDTYISYYLSLHHHSNNFSNGDCISSAKVAEAGRNDLSKLVMPQPSESMPRALTIIKPRKFTAQPLATTTSPSLNTSLTLTLTPAPTTKPVPTITPTPTTKQMPTTTLTPSTTPMHPITPSPITTPLPPSTLSPTTIPPPTTTPITTTTPTTTPRATTTTTPTTSPITITTPITTTTPIATTTSTPTAKTAFRKPADCLDILNFSGRQASSGVYEIFMESDPQRAIQVYCDQDTDGGGWTVFQRRMDETDFYRDWNEYSVGFGSKNGSHWLGLNTLAVLTKGNDTELRVDLEDWDSQKGFAVYKHFYVANEADKFRLDVSGYSGNIGDGLEYHNGMAFSTKDSDNDKGISSCAKHWHGAWWYQMCHKISSGRSSICHLDELEEQEAPFTQTYRNENTKAVV